MTKEEFIERQDRIKTPLIEKYGSFLYFLADTLIHVSTMEKLVMAKGYRVERQVFPETYMAYSKIYDGEKFIGIIENQGLPSICLENRCRKYAKTLSDDPNIIKPIEGIHRVLAWHEVKGKYHCLAGGQTVLHYLPIDITDEQMQNFLTKTGLIDKVEEFKKDEKELLIKANSQENNN